MPKQVLFNPYWASKPPECCYCPPVGYADEVPPGIEISTPIDAGFGRLAFMTRTEDQLRIIAAQRCKPINIVEGGNFPWGEPTRYSEEEPCQ